MTRKERQVILQAVVVMVNAINGIEKDDKSHDRLMSYARAISDYTINDFKRGVMDES
jgi:hypothetical protein